MNLFSHMETFNLSVFTIKSTSKSLRKNKVLYKYNKEIKISITKIDRLVIIYDTCSFWSYWLVASLGFTWNCLLWRDGLFDRLRCTGFTSVVFLGANDFKRLNVFGSILRGSCAPVLTMEFVHLFLFNFCVGSKCWLSQRPHTTGTPFASDD